MNKCSIAVDLDGTLIRTDTLHESLLKLVKTHPISLLLLPFWLLRGKAHFKKKVSAITTPSVALLPYNHDVIDWLKVQRNSNRLLLLCTAADESIGNDVARHLGIFERCVASDGNINMKGTVKHEMLKNLFPNRDFTYVGDSKVDLEVWRGAKSAVVVSNSRALKSHVSKFCEVEKVFHPPQKTLKDFASLLRVHQWAKNLLLLVPAIASHQVANPDILLTLILAFLSFSLCSSSVYILNDLLDLENDRRHPRKRNRPLASGKISIMTAGLLAPMLLMMSGIIATVISPNFINTLAIYYFFTCAYTVVLKKIVLLDCLVLAGLYTLRVIAGAAAISLGVSFWLLAFSAFLFLSLAFVKRFIELKELSAIGVEKIIHGRGYSNNDMGFVQTLGVSAGFTSVLVLALYIDSTASEQLYRLPEMVWGAAAVILFWISWIWLKANRGEVHDDPVVFAVTDKVSLACGVVFSTAVLLGITGLPA